MSSSGVEDEEILEVLRSADEPHLSTTAVADELPITRGRTRTRLQRLTDDDELERKTVGNEVVWWLAERADEIESEESAKAEAEAEAEAETQTETEAAEGNRGADEAGARPEPEEPGESGEPETAGTDQTGAVEADETETAEAEGDAKRVETPAVDEEAEPAPAKDVGQSDAGGPAEIEVEPVSDEITTGGSVTAVDRAESRGRPSDREGGTERPLRALAAIATAVVLAALLRRLLGRGRHG